MDAEPRSDVPPGHAGTTTEHEVASTTDEGQPPDPTEQADLQGEPSSGAGPTTEQFLIQLLYNDPPYHEWRASRHPAWDVP